MQNRNSSAGTAADSSTQPKLQRQAKLLPNHMLPAVDFGKLRPILFSSPMVQAILEGRKTQTRRTKGFAGVTNIYGMSEDKTCVIADFTTVGIEIKKSRLLCPYQIGDILWVRETFAEFSGIKPTKIYVYKADKIFDTPAKEHLSGNKWKPSLFMPYDACRLFLKVTSVRVERLNDISEQDAINEGVFDFEDGTYKNYFKQKGLRAIDGVECLLAKGSFQSLWENINGKGSWENNPFVWVIEFERCVKP